MSSGCVISTNDSWRSSSSGRIPPFDKERCWPSRSDSPSRQGRDPEVPLRTLYGSALHCLAKRLQISFAPSNPALRRLRARHCRRRRTGRMRGRRHMPIPRLRAGTVYSAVQLDAPPAIVSRGSPSDGSCAVFRVDAIDPKLPRIRAIRACRKVRNRYRSSLRFRPSNQISQIASLVALVARSSRSSLLRSAASAASRVATCTRVRCRSSATAANTRIVVE